MLEPQQNRIFPFIEEKAKSFFIFDFSEITNKIKNNITIKLSIFKKSNIDIEN